MNKVLFSSASEHWNTPVELYAALDAEFQFDFDPCPPNHAEIPLFGEGGLYKNWAGKRVFCNPPYGPKIRDFVAKGKEPDIAVFLLPARTDTKWWHEHAMKADEIRFLRGRLKFGGSKSSAPFPSVILIYRNA